jgi:hypothetical protein
MALDNISRLQRINTLTAATLLTTWIVSLGYPSVPHPVMFVKPPLKNEASKFSRKNANCSSPIASVDITVGIALFGGPPPAVSMVWEYGGMAASRLPRLIEEAQRSAIIFAEKRMVVVRAERVEVCFDDEPMSDVGREGELVCRLNLWKNAGLKYTDVGLGSRRDSRYFCGGNPCVSPV